MRGDMGWGPAVSPSDAVLQFPGLPDGERSLSNSHIDKPTLMQSEGLEGKEKQVSRLIPPGVHPSLPPPPS